MNSESENKQTIRNQLDEALREVKRLGMKAFKSGEWLFPLIHNSFEAYYNNCNEKYLRDKYRGFSDDQIIKKLTSIAARNASLLGALTGAAVSANDISALVVAAGTGGLNLPAQITLAAGSICAEGILLIRIQLQLIAEIAKIKKVPLNPKDPEDTLIILAFAIGGSASEIMGKAGVKAGGHLAKIGVKKYVSGATLNILKKFASQLGFKILQKSILKYAVPGAAIAIGAYWNYITTKAVAKIAIKHFTESQHQRSAKPPRKKISQKRVKLPTAKSKIRRKKKQG